MIFLLYSDTIVCNTQINCWAFQQGGHHYFWSFFAIFKGIIKQIEEEIRKNFDVAKDGEQVIILTGEEVIADVIEENEVVEYPWYQFWR